MWTTDVGRHGASNYGLLKVIFEMNLKLFETNSQKKLCFILRDFMPNLSKQQIEHDIRVDIDKIWAEIYKPEKYKHKQAQDFFAFEFVMMPHKIYQE